MEQLLTEGADIAVIGYHVNDNYTNVYSMARYEYYNMVGLPHVLIDGQQIFEWTYDDILAAYEERIAITTNYSISMDITRYGTTVNASINVGQIGAPNPETKVLHLVLTESHIPESWYGGEEVNHAERLMVPDQNGTSILSDSFDFEFEMDPAWLAQNCGLVTFVQDTISKEIMQARVFSLESTVLFNDVAVNSILSPGDSYCLNTISPVVEIKNYGADTLLTCVINYTINNDIYEYNWEGNLSTYQIEQVVLPAVNINVLEENTILIELSLPNGQEDEYPDNNSTDHNFDLSEVINQLPLLFELRTDTLASETSWELVNSADEIVYSGSGFENSTLYTMDWILEEEDCYTFNIHDTGGNGICCESGLGFYKIKDNTGEVYFIGGNFEDKETRMFQVDIGTAIYIPSVNSEINIYPNPANDYLNIETENKILYISIADAHGRQVFEQSNPINANIRIDVNKLQTGVYFVKIETEYGCDYYKIIKN